MTKQHSVDNGEFHHLNVSGKQRSHLGRLASEAQNDYAMVNSFQGEMRALQDDENSHSKSGNLEILEDAERSEDSFGREHSNEIHVKKKLGNTEEEEYFEFEDKRQDDGRNKDL